MLTGKQRSYLRKMANTINSILQIGKDGVNDNLVKQFDDNLETREIVKATVLNTSPSSVKEICQEIAIRTGAHIVQIIGHKFVLYRESKDNKVINL
jgi:RNA-binding protein